MKKYKSDIKVKEIIFYNKKIQNAKDYDLNGIQHPPPKKVSEIWIMKTMVKNFAKWVDGTPGKWNF